MANADTDGLKIGDLITLKSPKWEAFLSAEGILQDDLVVSEILQNFGDCLFAVHLQRQYSASRELQSFLATYNVDENTVLDEAMKQYLKALQKGRDNEVILNDNYVKNKVGQSVNFGDIIQLFHVKSRRYLTINPKKLARFERENSQAYLDSAGNVFSWLKFMPRFKIDREGDRFLSNSEAFLCVAERSNEFIHSADKSPKPGFEREVNCSLENTSWRMTIFQSCLAAQDKSLLMASQLVYIHDPETRSNLTVAKRPISSFDEAEELDEHGGFFHEFGDVILQPMGEILDNRCIWSVETQFLVAGGPVQWKTDQVRFKNVSTGLFLTMLRNPESEEDEVILTSTDDILSAGTLFSVQELNSLKNFISLSKALQISQDGVWLQRGAELQAKSLVLKGTRDKISAVSLLLNEYVQYAPPDEDVMDNRSPLDVYSGLSTRKYLHQYLGMIVIPRSRMVNTLWPGAEKSDMTFFQTLITKGKNFTQGFGVWDDHITLGVDKSNQLLRVARQRLICEIGILESLLRIVNRLKPITEVYDNSVRSGYDLNDSEKQVQDMGKEILSACLDFIYYCILDCPENQMYVADFLPDLLAHLSTQPGAGKCVTAMLSTNMELQETKMGEREISIFVEKLRNSSFNSMYLNLLQSCCSCQGEGVDNNQCRVAEMLFENPDGIIVDIRADLSNCSAQNWRESNSIYIKTNTDDRPIHGYNLLSDGIPMITLSWKALTDAYSAKALFGTEKVQIASVFPPSLNFKPKDDKSKRRLDIALYFINQLYLGAEMCMDRNYVAMHKLDPLFSFDILVSIMKLDLHTKLKAAACRLLFCLHIDRDPQAGSKIPCLTRTWDDVTMHEIPQLPYVQPERRNVYALVQQMCSEHVKEMQGSRWDIYSRFVLQLLLGMTRFNFYGTVEKLQDVIGPVVSALDRRGVVSEQEGKKKKSKEGASGDASSSLSDNSFTLNSAEESSEGKTISTETWQKRHFEFLESLPVMCVILALVLIAVTLTIIQVITNSEESHGMATFGLVVLAVFLYDFCMRFYCYVHTYGQPITFLCSAFNIIDQVVIGIDLVFLFLPSDIGGDNAKFTKTLRLIRLVRLVRVLRAVKVINALTKKKDDFVRYVAPARFVKTPLFELETMTEAINVLLFVQGVIEDRNLSILLRYFYVWNSGVDKRSPAELFEQVLQDSAALSLDINGFNEILADNLMFVHEPLVQGSLNVLMAHHSSRSQLLDYAKQVQLLVAPKRQKQFETIRGHVSRLEQNAETHELWGELESEEDHVQNKETKAILQALISAVRTTRYTLEPGSDFEPQKEMQDLLRNLGLVDISRKVMGLMDSVEPDEETGILSDVAKNTQDICRLCNELVYWFTLGNPLNQQIVYDDLGFYLETLNSGIKSHKLVKAIFFNNEDLMKLVPHHLLGNMADNICAEGKFHYYLALASAITHVGEKNIPKNQIEIIRTLCNPDVIEQTSCFMVPTEHDDYREKTSQMLPFKDERDVDVDSLPPLLAYHLAYLEVLGNCCSGKISVSAAEAKVQSIMPLKDLIEAIVDPDTILIAKIRLSSYILNSMIDVDMSLPGLCESRYMWNLIESYLPVLSFAKDEIRMVEKLGWESADVSRHRIEYILLAVDILRAFFTKNYDAAKLLNDDGTGGHERVSLSMGRVNDIIVTLFNSVREVYDLDTPRLQREHRAMMYECLTALNQAATNIIVTFIEPIHLEIAVGDEVEKDTDDVLELDILKKYQAFYDALSTSEEVQSSVSAEINGFIDIFENLDSVLEKSSSHELRFEPFIQKLVSHVRQNMISVDGMKSINAECTATSTWMIKAFRTQIENKMGMSIAERDDDGGEEEDIKAGPYVSLLNNNGVTGLCLELIAPGVDESLQTEVIKLLVAMLFKEGGAREVQSSVNTYLMKNDSALFFKQCRAMLQKLMAWHSWHEIIILEEGEDPSPPEQILLVRMLQLLSEGHFLPNQNIMREQPNNAIQYNLLDDFVNYYNVLSRFPCRTSTDAAIRVGATIVEVIQGPCVGNQNHIALNTEILEIQNRIMRSQIVNDCVEESEIEIKKICIDTISALLEGQMAKDPVTVRVLSVIHIDVFQSLAVPFVPEVAEGETPEEPNEDKVSLQTDCVVLLQMLCDYKPSLKKDMEDDDFKLDSGATACVEISWNGSLNRRFYHVPDVCHLLAKSSKDQLVQDVDRSNPENKLLDFLARAKILYMEIKHQEYLKEIGIAKIFSPQVHSTVTWIAFYLAIIINILFLIGYEVKEGDFDIPDDVSVVDYKGQFETDPTNVQVSDGIRNATYVLSALMIAASFFTIILTLVVRSPVIARGLSEDPEITAKWQVILYTALDPMTMYYCWYLSFACLGTFYHNMFITFLLLDLIVKNPTTADILASVVIPRKQLTIAFVLGAFTIYIYTFFIFSFLPYRILSDEAVEADGLDCQTLWGCYKYSMAYGFRAGGGAGDVLQHDISSVAVLHMTFYLIVTVAMLNIIFGIIIDTFSGLRSDKNDRNANTTETCFICSIGRQVFDRAANSPSGFKDHIKHDHNMWNYLNFIFFLWEQDKDDDDGLEYYVRHKIAMNEITWFPMSKAMCLDLGATDLEVLRVEVFSAISTTEAALIAKINELQADADLVLDQLSKAVEQDYSGAVSIKIGLSEYLAAAQKKAAAGIVGGDEGSLITEMASDLLDFEEFAGNKQLIFHVDSLSLPQFKTEQEFMGIKLMVKNFDGSVHQESAAKYDLAAKMVGFNPQNIVVVSNMNEIPHDIDIKSVAVELFSSGLVIGKVDIGLKELLSLEDNTQLTKIFNIGEIVCNLKCLVQVVTETGKIADGSVLGE